MTVKELGHLVLYVRDLERSAHFYREVLGWRPILDGAGSGFPAAAFNAPGGRTHHELLLIEVGPQAAPLPAGILHMHRLHIGAFAQQLAFEFAVAVEQYRHGISNAGFIKRRLLLTQQSLQALEAFIFYVFGDLLIDSGGRARARAVFK